MELARILNELWRHRIWVALGFLVAAIAATATVYRIDVFPPSLEEKSLEFGAADTQLLVDSRVPAIVDTDRDLVPLAGRAEVLSRVMTSEPVKRSIAAETGIPANRIDAQSEVNLDQPRQNREPSSEQRANGILGESVGYRLFFDVDGRLPIVSISAQAPTPREAIKLANGAVTGVQDYLGDLQAVQRVRRSARVQVRQLGSASGGTVNDGTSAAVALLTFLGVFVGACLLVLLAANLLKGWRQDRAIQQAATNGAEASGVSRLDREMVA